MNAIILAAGVGSRTSNYFGDKPKCLAELEEGYPLIKYTVEQLNRIGIKRVCLIVGYNAFYIKKLFQNNKKVLIIENPFFRTTNSLGSLWYARNCLDDDCFIMNGDVYMSEQMYDIASKLTKTSLLYDSSRVNEADYRFLIKDGLLIKHGKGLSNKETSGEYVGCCLISNQDIKKFSLLLTMMISKKLDNLWWENIIYNNINEFDAKFVDVNGFKWGEIDTVADYERIRKIYK